MGRKVTNRRKDFSRKLATDFKKDVFGSGSINTHPFDNGFGTGGDAGEVKAAR